MKKSIVFWLNMPSPHLMPFIEALDDMKLYDILCVFEQPVPKWRLETGFPEYKGNISSLYLDNDNWISIQNNILQDKKNAIHILGGFVGSQKIKSALDKLVKNKIFYYVISENNINPDRREVIKNFLRIIQMKYIHLRYESYCKGIFAIGNDAVAWFRKIGFKRHCVHDFIYSVSESNVKKNSNRTIGTKVKLAFLGRLIKRKGIDILLNALSLLNRDQYELVIIGDGPEKNKLMKLAEKLNIAGEIRFIGYVDNETAREIICSCDFLVVPSRYDGWAAVVNEAIDMGTPVICSSSVGAKDLVNFTGAGDVFKNKNYKDLASIISRVSDEEQIKEKRQAALEASKVINPISTAQYFYKVINTTDISEYIVRPWHTKIRSKRILILSPFFPPACKAGGVVRAIESIIKILHEQYCISVITWDRDYKELQPFPGVISNKWNDVNGVHVFFLEYSMKNQVSVVRSMVMEDNSDVIYINSLFCRPFSIGSYFGIYLKKQDRKILLAPRGELSTQALSINPIRKKLFIWMLKLIKLHKRVVFHATSIGEASDIRKIFGYYSPIMVAPDIYSREGKNEGSRSRFKKSGELKIVMVARISPIKNVDFALKCISKLQGEIIFDIFGPFIEPWYEEKCKKILKTLPSNIKASFNGPLPHDDIIEKLGNYHLFFLPSGSECFGHVIIEALTEKLPVLISDNTPWRDLESKLAGWDLPLTNPEMFTNVLNKMLAMNDGDYQCWTNGADAFAKEYNLKTEDRDATINMFNEVLFRNENRKSCMHN